MEHERTANALLLFYEKVRPRQFPADDVADMEEACLHKTESHSSSVTRGSASVGAGDGGKRTSSEQPLSAAHPPDNMSTSTVESDREGGAGEEKTAVAGGVGVGGAGGRAVVKATKRAGRRVGPGGVPLLDGVEAFSEEVWQANVQFMLNSYVFDTEFHHFLRRVFFFCLFCFFAGCTVEFVDEGEEGRKVRKYLLMTYTQQVCLLLVLPGCRF